MAHLRSKYDRQTTLNLAIAKLDEKIQIETKRLAFYQPTSYRTAYAHTWEMLSFYNARRRYLIGRLIKIQLEEFKRS